VILVDANILLYAEDSLSMHHESARTWWDAQLSGSAQLCLCWPVLTAFIRIATNARLHQRPLALKEAVDRVQSWIDQPCVRMILPTEQHWDILQRMLHDGNATANLVSDAHLAALAVEHNCELCSTDADFARFPGLNWRNPVIEKRKR
jgi:toxin-antitoxin system PIN domain toxin